MVSGVSAGEFDSSVALPAQRAFKLSCFTRLVARPRFRYLVYGRPDRLRRGRPQDVLFLDSCEGLAEASPVSFAILASLELSRLAYMRKDSLRRSATAWP